MNVESSINQRKGGQSSSSFSQLKSIRSGDLDRLAAHWDCTTGAAMWLSCQTTVDLAIDCWHVWHRIDTCMWRGLSGRNKATMTVMVCLDLCPWSSQSMAFQFSFTIQSQGASAHARPKQALHVSSIALYNLYLYLLRCLLDANVAHVQIDKTNCFKLPLAVQCTCAECFAP